MISKFARKLKNQQNNFSASRTVPLAEVMDKVKFEIIQQAAFCIAEAGCGSNTESNDLSTNGQHEEVSTLSPAENKAKVLILKLLCLTFLVNLKNVAIYSVKFYELSQLF